jgi:hypothetical protein
MSMMMMNLKRQFKEYGGEIKGEYLRGLAI